jgi:hypothetical protein
VVFIPTSSLIESHGWDNEIPDAYQRKRNPFWRLLSPLLGLPGEKDVPIDDNEGANAAIATIRQWEAMRTPHPPTLGDVAGAVVEAVQDAVQEAGKAVRRVTKIDQATAFLADLLHEHSALEAVAIEQQGKLAGHTAKNLRLAKNRIGAKSRRSKGKWFWTLNRTPKVDGA